MALLTSFVLPKRTTSSAKKTIIIPLEKFDSVHHKSDKHLFKYGDSLFERNRFDLALIAYQKSLKYPEVIAKQNNLLYAFNKLGRTQRVQGKYEEAKVYFDRSVGIINSYKGLDAHIISDTYYYLGRYYDRIKEPDSALFYLDKALEIRTSNKFTPSKDIADIYIGKGDVHRYIFNNYQMAKVYYKQGIALLMNSKGVDKRLVNALFVMGSVMRISGDYQQALMYLKQSLDTYNQSEIQINSYLSNVYNGLGNTYYNLNNYHDAINEYLKAIDIVIDENGDQDKNLVNYYNNIGENYSKLTRYDIALEYFAKAETLEAKNDKTNLSNIYLNKAAVYQQLGDMHLALYFLKETLNLRQAANAGKSEIAIAQFSLAEFYFNQNNLDSAALYCQQGIGSLTGSKLISFSDNPFVESLLPGNTLQSLLDLKGKILLEKYITSQDTQWLHAGVETYQLLDKAIDKTRSSYDLEGSKLFLAEKTKNYYENALNISFLLYEAEKREDIAELLYHFIGKSKAILLLQRLREQEELIADNDLKSLLLEEATILNKMSYYQRELASIKKSKAIDKVQSLEAEMFLLNKSIDGIKDSLATKHGEFFKNRNQIELVKVRDVIQYADRQRIQIVEFFWGKKMVFMFTVNPKTKSYTFFKQEQVDSLEVHIEAFQQEVQRAGLSKDRKGSFLQFVKSGEYIYSHLLADFLERDSTAVPKRVKFIPDGPLLGIPFDALLTPGNATATLDYKSLKYLLNDFIISYDYSSQIMIDNSNNSRMPDPEVMGFSFAGATPDIENDSQNFSELTESFEEVKAILNRLKGKHFAGNEATESNFKNYASKFDILHLAVHGVADSQNRFNSRLVFRSDNKVQEDGNLYPYELGSIGLKADLVVLSACETGTGKNLNGEGVYSMARGFLQANCASIVQSFWSVDDRPSRFVMQSFYDNINDGTPLDEALRIAKIDYLKTSDGIVGNPYNWAGFGILGNTDGFSFSSRNYWWWVVLPGLIVVILIMARKVKLAT